MSDLLFQILDRDLPTVPKNVVEIIKILQEPHSADIQEITAAVKKSRVLTKTILDMLNTGYFGIVRRIDSLETAVLMIGMDSLRYIILGVIIKMMFNKREAVRSVSQEAFLRHCIGTAIAAQELCQISKEYESCDLYKLLIYGMVHDIGILALDYCMPFTLNRIHNLAKEERIPILRAEAKIFGKLTHDVVGHWVCERWHLPQDIAQVVRYHHSPRLTEDFQPEVVLLYIADMISTSYYDSLLENEFDYKVDQKMLELLGLTEMDVEAVRNSLPARVDKALRAVNFNALDQANFD